VYKLDALEPLKKAVKAKIHSCMQALDRRSSSVRPLTAGLQDLEIA